MNCYRNILNQKLIIAERKSTALNSVVDPERGPGLPYAFFTLIVTSFLNQSNIWLKIVLLYKQPTFALFLWIWSFHRFISVGYLVMLCQGTIIQTGITCKIVICATLGVLLKKLKCFVKHYVSIFEFSRVWEIIESWLVYENDFYILSNQVSRLAFETFHEKKRNFNKV